MEKIIHKIDVFIDKGATWFLTVLSEYPYILIIVILGIIYIVNHIIQKRFQREPIGYHNIFFFITGIYLLYLWFNSTTYLVSINNFLINFHKVCGTNYKSLCSYVPSALTQDIILTIISIMFLIAINSRLMWVISVAIGEIYFVFGQGNLFYSLFDSIPDNQEYLFKGVISFILASPFLLVIWVFRDNDRYQDILNKQRELNLREKELKEKSWEREQNNNNKAQDLKMREKEYELRRKEYELKLK